jgi:hypothetical protein
MTDRPEPQAATFGPMVHRFGHRRPDEWDIPFYEWTTLSATDVDGREHIFEVPTAALAARATPDALRAEAESRAATLAAVREAVEGLEGYRDPRYSGDLVTPGLLTRAAVLSVIDKLASDGDA